LQLPIDKAARPSPEIFRGFNAVKGLNSLRLGLLDDFFYKIQGSLLIPIQPLILALIFALVEGCFVEVAGLFDATLCHHLIINCDSFGVAL